VANEIGLTVLYNQVDEGAWAEVADLHRRLDEAVARAYGWPVSVAHDPVEAKARRRSPSADRRGHDLLPIRLSRC
jgi:hypothetical protein